MATLPKGKLLKQSGETLSVSGWDKYHFPRVSQFQEGAADRTQGHPDVEVLEKGCRQFVQVHV